MSGVFCLFPVLLLVLIHTCYMTLSRVPLSLGYIVQFPGTTPDCGCARNCALKYQLINIPTVSSCIFAKEFGASS